MACATTGIMIALWMAPLIKRRAKGHLEHLLALVLCQLLGYGPSRFTPRRPSERYSGCSLVVSWTLLVSVKHCMECEGAYDNTVCILSILAICAGINPLGELSSQIAQPVRPQTDIGAVCHMTCWVQAKCFIAKNISLPILAFGDPAQWLMICSKTFGASSTILKASCQNLLLINLRYQEHNKTR